MITSFYWIDPFVITSCSSLILIKVFIYLFTLIFIWKRAKHSFELPTPSFFGAEFDHPLVVEERGPGEYEHLEQLRRSMVRRWRRRQCAQGRREQLTLCLHAVTW